MILTIKTSSPEVVIALLDEQRVTREHRWQAGHELSKQLLCQIEMLLAKSSHKWYDTSGVIVFVGPGSFTGLRIGITVGNTIAYSLGCPIVGTSGDDWQADGQELLAGGKNDRVVTPSYGQLPTITTPKK